MVSSRKRTVSLGVALIAVAGIVWLLYRGDYLTSSSSLLRAARAALDAGDVAAAERLAARAARRSNHAAEALFLASEAAQRAENFEAAVRYYELVDPASRDGAVA